MKGNIEWIELEGNPPPKHTHLLTVNRDMQCPTIFHNITDGTGRFVLTATEYGEFRSKHKPTHYAYMNFPEK